MRLPLVASVTAALSLCVCVSAGAQARTPPAPVLTDQASGTSALLQAVSPVNERVVWVSGHKATYTRTTDGGATWMAGTVPGDTTLQFRDVHAFNENAAYLMSSGTGKASRVYFTSDGGKTWALQHTNPDSSGFYDCMSFWDLNHGLVYGDEVGGQMVVVGTNDGGAHWGRIPPDRLPPAHTDEGGFAASGTCLVTLPGGEAWIGTGSGRSARVLHTADYGASWSAVDTPVYHDAAASGIATLAVRDPYNLMAAGGNIGGPTIYTSNIAVTSDGGATWRLVARPGMSGAIYGSAYATGMSTPAAVVVSPNGAQYSADNGASWTSLDSRAYWAVAFAPNGTGWMVGPQGRITKIQTR